MWRSHFGYCSLTVPSLLHCRKNSSSVTHVSICIFVLFSFFSFFFYKLILHLVFPLSNISCTSQLQRRGIHIMRRLSSCCQRYITQYCSYWRSNAIAPSASYDLLQASLYILSSVDCTFLVIPAIELLYSSQSLLSLQFTSFTMITRQLVLTLEVCLYHSLHSHAWKMLPQQS